MQPLHLRMFFSSGVVLLLSGRRKNIVEDGDAVVSVLSSEEADTFLEATDLAFKDVDAVYDTLTEARLCIAINDRILVNRRTDNGLYNDSDKSYK